MPKLINCLHELIIVLPAALGIGCFARLIRAILTPPPPLTLDWTPVIYGLAGFILTAIALQLAIHDRGILSHAAKSTLIVLNGSIFATYLGFVAYLLYQSLSRIY